MRDRLTACLESVFADLTGWAASVWVVDNASSDGSAETVRSRFPQVRLLANAHNPGFAAANNQALRALGFVQSPISALQSLPFAVLFLNPDTLVRPGALKAMVDFLRAAPRAGLVGAKLLNPDGTLQECAFDFPGLWQAAFDLFPPRGPLARLAGSRLNGRYPRQWFEWGLPFRIGHPLGAAFMARSQAIVEVGLMDEAYHMYCEEIDWAWRMQKAGWLAYCVPAAEVIHFGGQSTSQIKETSFVNLWRSRRRLYRTHRSRMIAWLVGVLVRTAMRRRARGAAAHSSSPFSEVAQLWTR